MAYILILVVIIAILAVIFALQNADPIIVSFLFFEIQSSLALVLLITLAIGILLGLGVSIPRMFKLQRNISGHKKEILDLEDRLQNALEQKGKPASPPAKPSPPANPESNAAKDLL